MHSPEELRLLVEQSQEGGAILERRTRTLIEGVFEFSEKNAREVMTPRTEIDRARRSMRRSTRRWRSSRRTQLSRYPVYDDSIDNIVGLVLAKDLLRVLRDAAGGHSRRSRSCAPVHVVPGSREVEEVLADFKRLKEHMAVVLDEYGGTAGIVTMEDLLEEIVGEILDEYDEPRAAASRRTPTATCSMPGRTEHRRAQRAVRARRCRDDDYTTIGGFVFGALGRLPVVGDRVTAGGGTAFTVRQMDGRRIETVAVDVPEPR